MFATTKSSATPPSFFFPECPSVHQNRAKKKIVHSNPLQHLLDERVDLVLAVTSLTALDKVHRLLSLESTVGVAQLERPQKVGSLLEGRADRGDFVDEVLDALDAVFAEGLLDDFVGGDGDALAVDLGEAALVDEFADGLEVGVSNKSQERSSAHTCFIEQRLKSAKKAQNSSCRCLCF